MTDGADPSDVLPASRSGIVIVVVAVLVAVIILGKGYEPGRSAIGPSASGATTTTRVTSTTIASRAPADVKVRSVNATNTQGLAGKVRDILQSRGYTQVTLADSPNKLLQTEIYFQPGAEAEAQAVARALGVGAANVRPMPDPPPVTPGDASVLVLAGVDLA